MSKKFKKYFPFFLFLIFGASLIGVSAAYSLDSAAEQLCDGSNCIIKDPNKIFDILSKIVQWAYTIFFIVAVFFILLAAFTFLTAQGDPEKVKGARNQIIWAIVAIVVALLSVGAAQIIKNFIP